MKARISLILCLVVALANSAAAQVLTEHSVSGGELYDGTAMTYKTPKDWVNRTTLLYDDFGTFAAGKDNGLAYQFWTAKTFSFNRSNNDHRFDAGDLPPTSVEAFLTNYPEANKFGKLVKVLDQNQHQVPAIFVHNNTRSVGQTGYVHGIFHDSDGKDHEIYLAATIQAEFNPIPSGYLGMWSVMNFTVLISPQGQLQKVGRIFLESLPTYHFTTNYMNALAEYIRAQSKGEFKRGQDLRQRTNAVTDRLAQGVIEFMKHTDYLPALADPQAVSSRISGFGFIR